jgi:hypothetical protein
MRSVGKNLHEPGAKKKFKKAVFDELDRLTDLMDQNTLTEYETLKSIESISNGSKVSFGQTQKQQFSANAFLHLGGNQNVNVT